MSVKFAPTREPRLFARARGWLPSLLVAAVALCAAFECKAQSCDLALAQAPDAVTINYNPFGAGASAAALDIKLENRADSACDLRLAFEDDAGAEIVGLPLGGVGVQFRPRETSGFTVSTLEPGVFHFTLAGHTTQEVQFDVAVVVEAVPEAGEHAADLQLIVRDTNRTELLPSIPVRVVLVSTPRAQLNLAGAAGAFGSDSSVEVVDFGDAVTGATRRIFVQVRANTPSILTIKSEHRGAMRRVTDDKIATESSVPYAVDLAGEAVDLSALWSKDVDPPRTLAGMSLPMSFTLGAVGSQMAGRYEDILTIDVSPN